RICRTYNSNTRGYVTSVCAGSSSRSGGWSSGIRGGWFTLASKSLPSFPQSILGRWLSSQGWEEGWRVAPLQ
ncbi:hypothetical protein HAX54_013490, partial [Datura stramonium]|nr:hypothetical protein [Datura stramonium]